MKKLLFSLLVLSFSVSADLINLTAIQINGIGVYQVAGGETYSAQAAWIPSIGLGGVGLRGELGVTLLKNAASSRFFAFNYEGFLTLPIIPAVFTIEAGGGLATWSGNGGTHPILSLYAVTGFPGPIHRLFLGYSRFLMPNNNANEWKLGFGFDL